jgi:LysR family glycine cleavage system transcriptional activator
MSWALPPLNPLKAFEATARLGTMTKASEELNITQVAISRQVANLEKSMRVQLFTRGGKRLQLTPAGETLFITLTRVFRELQEVSENVGVSRSKPILKICGYSNFTMRWLIPRLKDFHGRYPNIDLQLTTSMQTVDFDRSEFDAAIRSGDGRWPGWDCFEVAAIDLLPVCNVNVAATLRKNGPDSLHDFTLLHSIARPNDWRLWLGSLGIEGVDPQSGIKFDNGSLAYEAALEGVGVAIAQKILVMDDLRSGRLAAPFDHSVSSGESYWFVSPKSRRSSKLISFRDWLMTVCADVHGSIHLNSSDNTPTSAGHLT